ncbi:DUF4386 family protein [Microbacterium sp.]|uniref:DUF4386 family protein n=1 Tax=Microbacterium sp. TaxID=51671 RepID=UPI0039E2AEDB
MEVSIRSASIVSGVGLAAMAVIAPLGVMLALPAGLTAAAALVVLLVAALDVVVAVALYPVLCSGGTLLAAISAAMRLAYAPIFAAAAGALASGDVDGFQSTWDAGLLLFGAHLLLAGTATVRSRDMPTWLGALVLLAGVGYVFDACLVLLVPDATLRLGQFVFIGEVVLFIWLLGWGGRARNEKHG